MTDGTINISPSTLYGGSSTTAKNGGAADDLLNTLGTQFNTFLNLLSPLAGEPIVGPGATALMGALDEAGVGLGQVLGCFGTGLKILAPAMTREAQSFQSLDSTLSATFKELDGLLPQVENYATNVKLIAPTQTEVNTLKQYMTKAQQGQKIQIPTTTAAYKVQQPHQSGFMNWLGENQWAGWLAIGAVTIVGCALVETGPEGPGGALVLDGEILGAMDAADAAAATADVTTATADASATTDAAAVTAANVAAGGDAALETVGGQETFDEMINNEYTSEELANLKALADSSMLTSVS